VIDAEELWDVARHKVPEFVGELRPLCVLARNLKLLVSAVHVRMG